MMKNFKRLLSSLLVVFSILIATPLQANAAWKNDSQGWWYTSGSKYLTGWQSLDGNWYYFYGNGYMAHDCWIGDYYLNSNGAWTLDIPTQTTTATTNSTAVTNNQNNSQVCYLFLKIDKLQCYILLPNDPKNLQKNSLRIFPTLLRSHFAQTLDN